MKHLVIDGAFYLNASKSYQKTKRFFYNFLENDKYKYKKYFDLFMIAIIFISVAILVHEVKFKANDFLSFFNVYIVSTIFFLEYVLRFWVSSSVSDIIIKHNEHDDMLGKEFDLSSALYDVMIVKLKFITSIRAIIDLLAILPFFHELRLLRIFILFRVFKLFRYARSFHTFASVLATKKFEFYTLLMFASIVIFVSSVLIFVVEANNPESHIDTLFEAVYWSIVTISSVGYGDITPVSMSGRFVAIFIIISGIAVLAFTTSLVVSAFTEKLDEIRETKMVDDISKIKLFYIICGYENVAKEVAKKLITTHKIVVLDEDIHRVKEAQKDGLMALNYDPGAIESYKKLHIDIETQVEAVLCLRESDVENVYTTLTVRSISKDVMILSLLMKDMNRNKLAFAGVNEILYAKELVGMMAKEFIGKPVAFEFIHTLRSSFTNIDIEEINLTQRMLSSFSTVEELDNKRYRLVLLGIFKKEHKRFFFNPQENTILQHGDYLVVIGNNIFIKEFEKYLHTKIER